jgi:hypothetical protein
MLGASFKASRGFWMSARTLIELHPHAGIESHFFRITVDGQERASHLSAQDAEKQLARITDRMRSREGPLSVIRHVSTQGPTPVSTPCSWVPPECMALFDVEIRESALADGGPDEGDESDAEAEGEDQ